jgi:O-antigen ligase
MSIWKVNKILKLLMWSSFVMSLYTLLQYFKIEQFFEPKPFTEIGWGITNPYMVGNLGQPTIVAPFIALSVPIAIYLRKYFVAIILTATTLLINSRMTTSALIISLLIYLCMAKKEMILPVIIISLFVCIYIPQKFNLYQESNGRFQTWGMVIDDWKGSPVKESKERYSYFGVGLGSFGYIFHDKHKTIFHQAHNDVLEVLYSLGIVGLFLYLMAIYEGLKNGFIAYLHGHYFEKPLFIALMCSFILMFLNSLGTFLFQLGVYQYIAVLFFGLINNKNLIGRA